MGTMGFLITATPRVPTCPTWNYRMYWRILQNERDCLSVFPWRNLSWKFMSYLGRICSFTKYYPSLHFGQTSSDLAGSCAYHACSILLICVHTCLRYLVYIYIYKVSVDSVYPHKSIFIATLSTSRIMWFLNIFQNPSEYIIVHNCTNMEVS